MKKSGIKIIINEDVKKLLKSGHILIKEVQEVIKNAEDSGEKLYNPETNILLAKKRISKATFYVEYTVRGNEYVVNKAYSHKAEIVRAPE